MSRLSKFFPYRQRNLKIKVTVLFECPLEGYFLSSMAKLKLEIKQVIHLVLTIEIQIYIS